ncbi:unnamed protein product [Wickerhamomyces anomalus]
MEKVIKSIFCCSGEDSNSNTHSGSNNKSSSSRGSNNNQVSPHSSNQAVKQQLRANKQPQNNSNSNSNNNRYMDNQRSTAHQSSNHTSNNNNSNSQAKTDVNVYEATDSTLESNEDGQHSETTNNNNNNMNQQPNDNDVSLGQAHASNGWLLEDIEPKFKNKKCLVLDLDETLVHSSFKYLRQADFVIPVDIENQIHNVYVIKRPGVDEFLKRVGEIYEVVVFTASVSRYGDPLLDELDIHHAVHHRLFRDSCYNYQNNYIKNLSQLGRPLNDIIILDNSPASYIFHPQHAIPISSWFSDAHDNELLDIIPFLEDLAKDNVDDVGLVLDINL